MNKALFGFVINDYRKFPYKTIWNEFIIQNELWPGVSGSNTPAIPKIK